MKDTMRNYDNIKIAVVGMGYVGLSLAIMLAQHHEVLAVDIDTEKVELINKKCSPLKDEYVEKYLKETELHILATTDSKNAYKEANHLKDRLRGKKDKLQEFTDKYLKLMIEKE